MHSTIVLSRGHLITSQSKSIQSYEVNDDLVIGLFLAEIEQQADSVRRQKDRHLTDIQTFCDGAVRSVEGQLQAQLIVLNDHKNNVSREAKAVEALLLRVETHLRANTKSQLIGHSSKLLELFADVRYDPHCLFCCKCESCESLGVWLCRFTVDPFQAWNVCIR
jgi:hypothetical protein